MIGATEKDGSVGDRGAARLTGLAGPPPGDEAFVRSLALAGIFDLIGIVWLLTHATLLDALGAWLDRPGPRRAIRRATGTLLVGLGARVAVERS